MRRASSVDIKSVGDLCVNIDSFELHIRAENLSPATLVAYSGAARQFHSYLVDHGMPSDVADIRREHVESFIADLLLKWKPATANNRYRGLQSFFKWALEEGEVKMSPMANMKPPRIRENPPPVLREDDLKRLLATCEHSQDFESRRDAALIRVFIDTGARLSAIANLRWSPDDDTNNDVDLAGGILRVVGKGRRERILSIGAKTVRALDRYLRLRRARRTSQPFLALVGGKGACDALRCSPDSPETGPTGWSGRYLSLHVEAQLRPRVDERGVRWGEQSDESDGVAVPEYAGQVRRFSCFGTCVIRPQTVELRRPVIR